MTDKIKLILKGILLYITVFYAIVYLTAIDSLVLDYAELLIATLSGIPLVIACFYYISKEDFDKLTNF